MKRLITALLTLLLFIGIPSCKCPNFRVIRDIVSVQFFNPTTFGNINETNFDTDSLGMELVLDVQSYTSNFEGFGSMNSAYGYFSECSSISPFANRIIGIDVVSDQMFNNIPAGESLMPFLRGTIDRFDTYFVIPDLILELQNRNEIFFFTNSLDLIFIEKPTLSNHTFTIKMMDDSDHEFSIKTPAITWN